MKILSICGAIPPAVWEILVILIAVIWSRPITVRVGEKALGGESNTRQSDRVELVGV